MKLFSKKAKPLPPGCGPNDIGTESSVCTGETVIGFRDKTGKLKDAVVCRTNADRDGFYRSYGLKPPE